VPKAELGRILAEEVRDEDGDLVTCGFDGCLVLLQGARWDSAQAFLSRFRGSLDKRVGHDSALRAEVWINPADQAEIKGALAWVKGQSTDGTPAPDRRESGAQDG
jgi:hypothetical protein